MLEQEALAVPHERQRVDEVLVEDRHAIDYQSSIVIVVVPAGAVAVVVVVERERIELDQRKVLHGQFDVLDGEKTLA